MSDFQGYVSYKDDDSDSETGAIMNRKNDQTRQIHSKEFFEKRGELKEDYADYDALLDERAILQKIRLRKGGILSALSQVGMEPHHLGFYTKQVLIPELGGAVVGSELPYSAYLMMRMEFPHSFIMAWEDNMVEKKIIDFENMTEKQILSIMKGTEMRKKDMSAVLKNVLKHNPIKALTILQNVRKVPELSAILSKAGFSI